MNKRRFLGNAVLMAFVHMLLRFVSVRFNAFVSARIGAEGMGLISLLMSVYGLSVTLATSGVHLAAVRLSARAVAESEKEEYRHGSARLRRVMRGCALYSLLFGVGAAVLLFLFSEAIGTHLLGDVRTVPSLRVLALSLPAISLASALNGYFTAVRKVYKNALISLAEQFVKITLTSALLLLITPAGIEYACLAVIGGGAVAEGMSLLAALCLYFSDKTRQRKGNPLPRTSAFAEVFRTAFPVAVGAYARQGLLSAEHLSIPRGFRKHGASASSALASYGVLHGMVYPLILLPSAVLSAFAGLLIPEFTHWQAQNSGDTIRHAAEKVLKTSLAFAIGTAGIFLSFSYSIGESLYPGTEASLQLARIAPLIPVMYLDTAVDGMLKGLGEQVYCMRVNIADSLCCLILVWILLPRYGLAGYFLVQYICEILNASLSVHRLLQITEMRPRVGSWVIRPLLCVIAATSVIHFFSGFPAVPLIGAGGYAGARLIAAVFLYLAALLLTEKGRFFYKKRSCP